MVEAQYNSTFSIGAPLAKVSAYFKDSSKLAMIDGGSFSITGTYSVGSTVPMSITGVAFQGTFTKLGSAADGSFEIEWGGTAIPGVAVIEHGFLLKSEGAMKTTVTHYERFVGGALSCLPPAVPLAIVGANYTKWEHALTMACEA